jgi:hypothetical protein
MTRKLAKSKKRVVESGDEHELLQQENFTWLSEFRDMLSPYWSARVEYDPEGKSHVIALEGSKPDGR